MYIRWDFYEETGSRGLVMLFFEIKCPSACFWWRRWGFQMRLPKRGMERFANWKSSHLSDFWTPQNLYHDTWEQVGWCQQENLWPAMRVQRRRKRVCILQLLPDRLLKVDAPAQWKRIAEMCMQNNDIATGLHGKWSEIIHVSINEISGEDAGPLYLQITHWCNSLRFSKIEKSWSCIRSTY